MKVRVLGLGVSGSFLAYLLASRGFVVEGYDLSKRYFKACGDAMALKELSNRVVRATESELSKPKGFSIMLEGEEVAYLSLKPPPWTIVNKEKLVEALREMAAAEGAVLKYGKSQGATLVDARGPFAARREELTNAVVIVAKTKWEPREVSLDLTLRRRGTYWVFPLDDDGRLVNLGVGFDSWRSAALLRQLAVKRFEKRFGRLEVIKSAAAPIALWRPIKLKEGSSFLVGEAAGFVGRLNGEGNRMALYSAAALAEALERGSGALQKYAQLTGRFANEVMASALLLDLLGSLPYAVAKEAITNAPKALWESWLRTELTFQRLLSLLPATAPSLFAKLRGRPRRWRPSLSY
ncbi:MAG: hypothetical protein N3F67_00650 [Acidilobaceae archaeon]|nr:hypothetical protein [Acidilobaceae archaeon]